MDGNIQAGSGIELDLIDIPGLPELDDEQSDDNENLSSSAPEAEPKNSDENQTLSLILENLDKKMKSGRFLHTFTAQIEEINRIINMKYASTKDIAAVILKDVALASKVLSVVNSCYYGQFSRKGISSIAEAMVILGTEEVQQAAATLLLFEFMRDIAKSEMLKEKSLASLMRGMMARDIAKNSKYDDIDEFQLAAMLYDIGEQIILFCEPEAYKKISKIAKIKSIEKDAVSRKVLGASFTSIARGIVSGWGFPGNVVDSIQPFKEFNLPPEKLTGAILKRIVASFTSEMCGIDWRRGDSARQQRLEEIVNKYGHLIDIGLMFADDLLTSSIQKVEKHAALLNVSLRNSRFDRSVSDGRSYGETEDDSSMAIQRLPEESDIVSDGIQQEGLQESDLIHRVGWIEDQISGIESSLRSGFRLSEILHRIITIIYKGFFFSRISICIMDKSIGMMVVRFVLGNDKERFGKEFRFRVDDSDDLFNKALGTGLDIVIEDSTDRLFNSRIPAWYIECNFASSFAVYPVVVEGRKVGLIYVDWDRKLTHLFSPQIKYLMQRLKNLTITAIKKSRLSS